MFSTIILWLLTLQVAVAVNDDPAASQLLNFRKTHPNPVGMLTTSSGTPVSISNLNSLNGDLLENEFFMDSITRFVRERIPERVVHARGSGAFGYFEVTNDITNICKAKLFEKIGKKTPIVVRFSTSHTSRGGSETNRESRGFAVKFYTEEGNFDIIGGNIPVLAINDPIWVPPLVHALRPNPATNVADLTSFWDFVTLRKETLFETLYIATNRGTPDGYRYIPGYSIHTYQVVNNRNATYFMRFQFTPDAGEKYLNSSEATRIAGQDPDYATRDLYNAIAKGNFPTWTLNAQILSVADVLKAKINPFDITKVLDEEEYPLQPIGRLVLNRNPRNHFADVEQLAFCTCHLVPGILGAPDKAFEARGLAYRNAHSHRLGGNSQKIPVNCPYRTKVRTYNRDGEPPVGDNENDTPNYIPNSFNGPIPTINQPKLLKLRQDYTSNLDQCQSFYNSLSSSEQNDIVQNLATSMCYVPKFIQEKVFVLLCEVNSELGKRVKNNIRYC